MVVNQLVHPVVAVGRRNARGTGAAVTSPGSMTAGTALGSRSTIAITALPSCRHMAGVRASRRSLQRLQVGDEVGDLVFLQLQVRHDRPGLLTGRVPQPRRDARLVG